MKYTVKIIIATHKKYQMPQDQLYIPLHVGAEGKIDTCGNVLDFGYISTFYPAFAPFDNHFESGIKIPMWSPTENRFQL